MRIGVIGVNQGYIVYAGVERGGKKSALARAERRRELLQSKGIKVFLIENPDMRKIRLYNRWKGAETCRQ